MSLALQFSSRIARRVASNRILWVLVSVFVSQTLLLLVRLEPTASWLATWADDFMVKLPQGWVAQVVGIQTLAGPAVYPLTVSFPPNSSRSGPIHGLEAVWFHLRLNTYDYTVPLIGFHAAVCGLVLLLYHFRGFPPLLGAAPPAVVRPGRIYLDTFGRAALWSVMWLPLAHLAKVFFWVARHPPNPLMVDGTGWPRLAVGATGFGLITAGAILAHILTVSYTLRAAVVAAARRSVSPVLPCPCCGYARPRLDTARCPECGQTACPDRAAVNQRVVFALGRRLAAVAAGRWRWLPPTMAVLLIVGLYGAPYFLPLLGRALPPSTVNSIGEHWFKLWS